MSLAMNSSAHRGFVAIWNKISPGPCEEDFKAWHEKEHMPERLAIPGFLSGTRWCADDCRQSFFTLYTLEQQQVALSPAYLGRLNHPTAWTRRVMSGFQENSRCVGAFVASLGAPASERVAIARFEQWPAETIGSVAAERTLNVAGVTGFHLGRADSAASSLASTEREGREVREPAGLAILPLEREADTALVIQKLATTLADLPFGSLTVFNRELTMP
jgi:hypothetical protein